MMRRAVFRVPRPNSSLARVRASPASLLPLLALPLLALGQRVAVGVDGRQAPSTCSSSTSSSSSARCLRDLLAFSGLNGGPALKPADLEGKAVLLVNTASLCGYTPQLTSLQRLSERYSGRGLAVVAVPSNDFGQQEPWDEERVERFYREEHGVSFFVSSKQRVAGGDVHPAYAWIERRLGHDGAPQWNFAK
jgi:glutathione peroxidase